MTESEELELLELERERSKIGGMGDIGLLQQKKPNAISNFFGVPKLREELKKGAEETADLATQGKIPQAYLHSLGTIGGQIGGAVGYPMLNLGKALLPKAAEEKIGSAAKWLMTPTSENKVPSIPLPGMTGTSQIAPSEQKPSAIDFAEKHPDIARGFGDVMNIAGAIPAIKGGTMAGNVTKSTIRATGEGTENLGKRILSGELKIKQALAERGYGKSIDDKKQQIISNIVKYDLPETMGNFSKMSQKASDLATERFNKVDEIVQAISKDQNAPLVNPVRELENIIDVNKIASAGELDQAANTIKGVIGDLRKMGLDQDLTVDNLIKAKQSIDRRGDLFKKGPSPSDADNLNRAIRKAMYLKLVDKIGEISPEIKQLNTEAKELLDIKAIASDASGRIMNRDIVGLSDYIIGGAGLLEPGSLAYSVGGIAMKKSLGQGKAAAALIKTGRALQGKKTETGNVGKIQPPKFEPKSLENITPIKIEDLNIPAYKRTGKQLPNNEDFVKQDIIDKFMSDPNRIDIDPEVLKNIQIDKDFVKYITREKEKGLYRGPYRNMNEGYSLRGNKK